MKKSLLATAVAIVVAAPMAAQADVTLYGRAMASGGWMDSDGSFDGNGGGNEDNVFLSSHSSRIGVKGAEDLGGGLQAIFGIEWEVDITGRARDLNARNRFVGLSGGFGSLLLARHDTPFKTIGRKINFFGDMLGDNRDATNFYHSASVRVGTNPDGTPVLVNLDGTDAELRLDNVIGYVSPTWAGFHVFAAYSTDHNQTTGADNTDQNKTDAWSVAAEYENGPFWLGGAWEMRDGVSTTATDQLWRIATKFEWNDFEFGGTYQHMYNVGGENTRVTVFDASGNVVATNVAPGDGGVWGVGGSYKFGNNKALVQYYRALELDNIDNTDGGMLAVGLEHFFSKRTRLFATYEWMSAGDNVSYRLADNNGMGDEAPYSSKFGGDPMGFSVGVRHDF
jgi:predicted porin